MLKGLPLPELRKWCMANGAFSRSVPNHQLLWNLRASLRALLLQFCMYATYYCCYMSCAVDSR